MDALRATDEVVLTFVEESSERLANIESRLLAMENSSVPDETAINSVFRDAHSIKAGANLLELRNIETLAHRIENIFEQMRQGRFLADSTSVTVLLEALDKIKDMVERIVDSDTISITLQLAMLDTLTEPDG